MKKEGKQKKEKGRNKENNVWSHENLIHGAQLWGAPIGKAAENLAEVTQKPGNLLANTTWKFTVPMKGNTVQKSSAIHFPPDSEYPLNGKYPLGLFWALGWTCGLLTAWGT